MSVAEELHFGRAAARLHISQPPLSRQIKQLEDELGCKLVERMSKGVALTPAGAYLKIEAARLLSMTASIKERVRRIGESGTRRVRIGYVGSIMHSFLPELVGEFRRAFPQLGYEFLELGTEDLARALRQGRLDLGFLRSWQKESGVRFEPLVEERLLIVHAKDLQVPGGKNADLGDFRDLPFIGFSPSCAPGVAERALAACERAGFVPRVFFTANQFDTALRLVAAGLGWSIVPSFALGSDGSDLITSRLKDIAERIELGVALREGEEDPILRELFEMAIARFSDRAGQ
jgi:DNA-binding transcriptional LysR family regulator